MSGYPRVAYFTDCFHEINGVARTSRELAAFAGRQHRPFLSVHCGEEEKAYDEGDVRTLELRRAAVAFPLEADFGYDPFLWRYYRRVAREARAFEPDIIHVTSPGDVGQMGAYLAYRLGVPLVAAWHTNLHEYAEQRLEHRMLRFPKRLRTCLVPFSRQVSLGVLQWFYGMASLLLAPTEEIAQWLQTSFRRPIRLMKRGVDTRMFNPAKRRVDDGVFRMGFVGRLSPEKNLRFLCDIERFLKTSQRGRFKFVIVGEGKEREWLEQHLEHAEFTGTLTGEALARTYADMDLFVFPSKTDTFGNVILEAHASGVPAVVTNEGGPKHIVRAGFTGLIAKDERDFMESVLTLMSMEELRISMSRAAREFATRASWDEVFQGLYEDYFIPWHETEELLAVS
jgi:glycosyltransferase involved in cell wall biosynthesis